MKKLATVAMIAALSVPSLALAGSPTAVAPVEVVADEPAGLSGGSSGTAAIIALAAILLIAAADDSSSGT